MKPRLLMGVVIILVGGLLLLGNLQIIQVGNIWQFWPVILIVAGVNMLIRCGWGRGSEGGIVLTVLGVAFLLRNLGLLDWRFRQLWPLLLILIGVMIVVSAFKSASSAKPKVAGSDSSPRINLFTALGGVDHKNNSSAFQGGEVSAVMGGIEIDLRDAKLSDAGAELQCGAFMGGIEITVPREWSVEVKGTPVLGYFGDTRRTIQTEAGPKLVVKGQVIMGAVEVKN